MNVPIDLRKAVRHLNSLPALPVIAHKLMGLNLDSEEGERQMLFLIAQDPMISAKIIGLANSPLLGASRHIAAVRDAAMMLGLTRVKSVAIGIAVMSLVNKPIGRFDPQELWMHSIGLSYAMLPVVDAMPAKNRPQDDIIFLSGMLHDIGYLVLAHLDPQLSDDLHARLVIEPERLAIDVERELLDVTHDELGADLAKYWNLPSEIVAVLRYHHRPDAAEAAEGQPMVRIINLTEKLLPTLGLREFVGNYVAREEWITLGIDPDQAALITEQAVEQANQAAQFSASLS